LSSPEKTSTNTKQGTCKDVEATDTGVNRDKQTDGIDTVTNTAKSERDLDTELVDESSTKEAKDCKG
jgi:hypothetical protein